MGLVIKQATRNLFLTVTGFSLGAINVLFLYTHILQPEHFGLVTFVLAFGALLMPVLSFGMHNAMLRFFSQLNQDEQKDQFLGFLLLFPLAMAVLWSFLLGLGYDFLAAALSGKNPIVGDYIWYVFGMGLAMAYFELGYAYAKVQLATVWGNALKEVFVRLGVTLLLILVYTDIIDEWSFLPCLLALYLLRAGLMWLGAVRLRGISWKSGLPPNYKEIIQYGLLMLLGSSASIIILEIDKVMLNSYRLIQEVAYYGVAIYIATVVAMPYRAMYHISAPLTATHINQNQIEELRLLYRRSSLSLFTVAGGLFFLIIVNLRDLYGYLPEGFGGFYPVVFLVGITKLTDSLSGTANSILFYSRYYTYVLVMGVGLAVMTVSLNALLIPQYGALGCAWATLISVLSYNVVKVVFIKRAFGFHPFSAHTLYNLLLVAVFLLAGMYLPLPANIEPWMRMGIRSLLLGAAFVGLHYRFDLSPEVHRMLRSYLKRKSHGPNEPRDSNN